jgi:hypothetical protein
LDHLKKLTQLQMLSVKGRPITDAGLEHLEGMAQLRVLILCDMEITDAGLEHLKGLTNLRVFLKHTKVTSEGARRLRQATQMCEIVPP